MEDNERQSGFLTALTTEHFVLQTAANGIVSEEGARASLYILALSSSLVAMGFASRAPDVFVPFVATVLPALFLLGVFSAVRLVDGNLEINQLLTHIARIRGYYRSLSQRPNCFSRQAPGAGLKRARGLRCGWDRRSRSSRPPPAWSRSSTASSPAPASLCSPASAYRITASLFPWRSASSPH